MGWLQQFAVPCLVTSAAMSLASAGGVRAGRSTATAARSLQTSVSTEVSSSCLARFYCCGRWLRRVFSVHVDSFDQYDTHRNPIRADASPERYASSEVTNNINQVETDAHSAALRESIANAVKEICICCAGLVRICTRNVRK